MKAALKGMLASLPTPVLLILRGVLVVPVRTYVRYAPWSFGKQFLFDHIASHLWWMEGDVRARTRFGDTLEVDASDIVGKYIYYFGIWEPDLSAWMVARIQPGDLVVDVGANIGYFTVLASRLVGPAGRVVAIEAMPSIFNRLVRNIVHSGRINVRAVNVAAWSKEDTLTIYARSQRATGVTTLIREWATRWALSDEITVDARALRSVLSADEIRTARVIKIDVEGAEWPVITEMAGWLNDCNDELEIVIEVSRRMLEVHGKDFKELLGLFGQFGFAAYRLQNDYQPARHIQAAAARAVPLLVQIDRWPDENVDQIDFVLSRTHIA